MTSIVTPDCDWADRLDLRKQKGCRARSQFLIYLYDQTDAMKKPFGKAGFLTCRHHAKDVHTMVLVIAETLMKTQKEEKVMIKGVEHTFDNRIKLGMRVIDITKHPHELRLYIANTKDAQDAVRNRLS